MSLKIYLVAITSLFFVNVSAQKVVVDSDSLIVSIRKEITSFFIKLDVLKSDEINGNLRSVYATELKELSTLGFKKNGIYGIGVFQKHTPRHILIKEGSNFEIFDLRELGTALKAIVDYSKRNNLNSDELLLYVKSVIQIYDTNKKISESD